MIVHQLPCWSSQGYILVGSHILVGQHAIEPFISLGFLAISNTVDLHGWFI